MLSDSKLELFRKYFATIIKIASIFISKDAAANEIVKTRKFKTFAVLDHILHEIKYGKIAIIAILTDLKATKLWFLLIPGLKMKQIQSI